MRYVKYSLSDLRISGSNLKDHLVISSSPKRKTSNKPKTRDKGTVRGEGDVPSLQTQDTVQSYVGRWGTGQILRIIRRLAGREQEGGEGPILVFRQPVGWEAHPLPLTHAGPSEDQVPSSQGEVGQ